MLIGATGQKKVTKRLGAIFYWPFNTFRVWLENQTYNDYWKQGSVCEEAARVGIPVLAIGNFLQFPSWPALLVSLFPLDFLISFVPLDILSRAPRTKSTLLQYFATKVATLTLHASNS